MAQLSHGSHAAMGRKVSCCTAGRPPPWAVGACQCRYAPRMTLPLPELQNLSAAAADDAARALHEDVGDGDLTASLVPQDRHATARILARESAVICGRPWVDATLRQVDGSIEARWLVEEGARCEANEVVLELAGPARSLLTADRPPL